MIRLHVLLLLLYRELLHVLLDVKQIVDLFLSFIDRGFKWKGKESVDEQEESIASTSIHYKEASR